MRRLLLLVFSLGLAACNAPQEAPRPLSADSLRTVWEEEVAAKTALFQSERSPVPEPLRDRFEGPDYFPYDSTLVFPVVLEPALERDTLGLSTTVGPPRPYVRYGAFAFQHGGRMQRLAVYQPAGPNPRQLLFVPFLDVTSNRSTYGAGRYLDLRENERGVYVLDFNRAYNPYCAYDSRFSCPLPPAENRLGFAVTAGQKKPDLPTASG